MKSCKRCQLIKPTSEFHNRSCNKDGKAIYCKPCNKSMMRSKTKEQALRDSKNYALRHPEKVKASFKNWYENNKEEHLNRRKILNSTPVRLVKIKKWQDSYRETANLKRRKRTKTPKQIIEKTLRDRFNKVIIRAKSGTKYTSCLNLVGCDLDTFKSHIDSQFVDGMTWLNHGNGLNKWNVDHIRPLCTFNLFDLNEQLVAFNYLNLRPLWFVDNMKRPRKNQLWQK